MPQHYATATISRLVEGANRVQATHDRSTLLRVVNGETEDRSEKSRKVAQKGRTG
jgi:hypothetical protein